LPTGCFPDGSERGVGGLSTGTQVLKYEKHTHQLEWDVAWREFFKIIF